MSKYSSKSGRDREARGLPRNDKILFRRFGLTQADLDEADLEDFLENLRSRSTGSRGNSLSPVSISSSDIPTPTISGPGYTTDYINTPDFVKTFTKKSTHKTKKGTHYIPTHNEPGILTEALGNIFGVNTKYKLPVDKPKPRQSEIIIDNNADSWLVKGSKALMDNVLPVLELANYNDIYNYEDLLSEEDIEMPARRRYTSKRRYGSKRYGSKRRSYTGRGAYRSTGSKRRTYRRRSTTSPAAAIGWNVLNTLGRVGATAAGSFIGGPGGAAIANGLYEGGRGLLSSAIGGAMGSFAGMGDYVANDVTNVASNSLLTSSSSMPAVVNVDTHGGVVIRKSEYLGEVVSGAANTFKIDTYAINPGVEQTFPWLAQIANCWDEYILEGIYFEFRSTSGNALNSTNTALGTVVMSCQYDSADATFESKQEMEQYDGLSIKPSQSARFFVECAPAKTVLGHLYTRMNAPPAGTDIRLYDIGKFSIATSGFQGANVVAGELWVSYQFSFLKNKLFNTLGYYTSFFRAGLTSYTNAFPINFTGSTVTYNSKNNWPIILANNVIKFPISQTPQTYFVSVRWVGGTAVTLVYPLVTATSNAIIQGAAQSPPTADTASVCQYTAFVKVVFDSVNPSVIPSLTFGGAGTLPAAPQQIIIDIIQVPNGVY